MRLCTIWYHVYDLKNVKNTHGGVLLLVKFQAEVCNFAKSNIPPWVFSSFKVVHMVPNRAKCLNLASGEQVPPRSGC